MSKFPHNFLWGAATAAHQVEGGTHNDWSEWEQANAVRLAQEAPHKFQSWLKGWPEIAEQATNPATYLSGRATDHFHRYAKDFDIMQQLGLTAYRFSLEWSRIEPRDGEFNTEALAHYGKVLDALQQRHIEPIVTLWHWPIPLWLRDQGGWASPRTIHYFERFTLRIVEALGDRITWWLTLNEPEIYTDMSYRAGHWPPQHQNWRQSIRVLHNLVRAHIAAYQAIKASRPNAMVGIAANEVAFEAGDLSVRTALTRGLARYFNNYYFLDRIQHHQDYIGINYYFHNRIERGHLDRNRNSRVSDLGWELYPQGISQVLNEVWRRYRKPLLVTENGLADRSDGQRAWFIEETIKALGESLGQGVDLRGYLHWSLLDNFEWDKGFWPRFGLVDVDYQTLERRIRPSARRYAELIKQCTADS